MTAKNFELFMCCMGNGTTVCNKAVTEHGDYKQVAHISEHGHVEFFVPKNYIPIADLDHIICCAEADRRKFMERWNQKDYIQKWSYMMNLSTIGCGYTAIEIVNREHKHLPLKERVPYMEKVFFETHM